MTILIIDTAFEFCQVGLWRDGKKLDARITQGGGKHDHVLASMVDDIFKANDLMVEALAQIFVTTGPGRFTGLRVGIAFARGLALVHGTPLTGVLTTEALAWEVQRSYGRTEHVTIMIGVKRGESFVQPCLPQLLPVVRVMDDELMAYFKADTMVVGMIAPETRAILETVDQVMVDAEITYPSLEAIYQAGMLADASAGEAVRPYYAA